MHLIDIPSQPGCCRHGAWSAYVAAQACELSTTLVLALTCGIALREPDVHINLKCCTEALTCRARCVRPLRPALAGCHKPSPKPFHAASLHRHTAASASSASAGSSGSQVRRSLCGPIGHASCNGCCAVAGICLQLPVRPSLLRTFNLLRAQFSSGTQQCISTGYGRITWTCSSATASRIAFAPASGTAAVCAGAGQRLPAHTPDHLLLPMDRVRGPAAHCSTGMSLGASADISDCSRD